MGSFVRRLLDNGYKVLLQDLTLLYSAVNWVRG